VLTGSVCAVVGSEWPAAAQRPSKSPDASVALVAGSPAPDQLIIVEIARSFVRLLGHQNPHGADWRPLRALKIVSRSGDACPLFDLGREPGLRPGLLLMHRQHPVNYCIEEPSAIPF
jgi:hypothetical protein